MVRNGSFFRVKQLLQFYWFLFRGESNNFVAAVEGNQLWKKCTINVTYKKNI